MKKAFITPTTHWDREWVMTFGQFQVRLVNLFDNLIKIMEQNPDYRFLFDGQAIVLEDYLEIHPEHEDKLRAFMRSGQLTTGPWYVLADQFLENGESTIRNLMRGRELICSFGGRPMELGYVPDSFGSVSTLPMILNGFGIKYAAFGRGRPYWNEKLPKTEFIWECEDSSRVLAVNHGYGNGVFMSYPNIWADIMNISSFTFDEKPILEQFMREAAGQLERGTSQNVYFSVGCDHMEPRSSLPHVMDYINSHQSEYELVYATPEDYAKAVEGEASSLSTYKGELRGSQENPMDLVGTLSSNIRLKQDNDACEVLLQKYLEPLWTVLSVAAGAKYPKGHLNKLWKLLLTNHPHDSICGCSLDQVHRDMYGRFEQIKSIGEYLIKDGLRLLLSYIDTSAPFEGAVTVTVFNPLGYDYSGPVRGLVRVPEMYKHDAYTLVERDGTTVPSRITHVAAKHKDLESVYMTSKSLSVLISKNAQAENGNANVYSVLDVDFSAQSIPAMGYKTYWIILEERNVSPSVTLTEDGMENEWLDVRFNDDGTFDIKDKFTGHIYPSLCYLADREDTGDTYDSHGFTVPQERVTRDCRVNWTPQEVLGHRVSFRAVIPFELPECLDGDKRSADTSIVPITLTATLHAGIKRLDITTQLDNTCRDHILRAVFDTGLTGGAYAYDHFNVLSRPLSTSEREWTDSPFQEFVDISDGQHGLCVSAKGLPAYEAVSTPDGTRLYLTLLRAVGSIGPAAGANYPTPAAQCRGEHTFEYSIIPHEGDWIKGDCLRQASLYRVPPLLEADNTHGGQLTPSARFVELDCLGQTKPYVSCLKKSEDGEGTILRFWNPNGAERVSVRSTLGGTIKSVNLDETPRDSQSVEDGVVEVNKHSLTTLKIL
ncbi:MAG: alpha-mannosidase [Eubacteriales bacterium]